MATIKGPVLCPSPIHCPLTNKAFNLRSGFRVSKRGSNNPIQSASFSFRSCQRRNWPIYSSFSSHSGGSGNIIGGFSENEEDYVDSSVIEAEEVRSGPHGLMIKMCDGKNIRCVFNNPKNMLLPDTNPHPAIVLKMEDGTGLLLPIIVVELPNIMLLDAVRNVKTARPTVYQVLKDMIHTMGYEVHRARITQRNHEIYVAKLYLSQAGNEKEAKVIDLKPSDAINIAVQCKAQIQVNKRLAYNDGMRIVDPPNQFRNSLHFSLQDNQSGYEEEEFDLIKNMMIAASEESSIQEQASTSPIKEKELDMIVE
ncbi:hypothetical protein LUZ60_008167 [Juncus effusus]|nr:hypothetical protein LUZ60_008167 [Juncus effusus]